MAGLKGALQTGKLRPREGKGQLKSQSRSLLPLPGPLQVTCVGVLFLSGSSAARFTGEGTEAESMLRVLTGLVSGAGTRLPDPRACGSLGTAPCPAPTLSFITWPC